MTTHGPFTFDRNDKGSDVDRFLYEDPIEGEYNLPKSSGTYRRWCHSTLDTPSGGVGPTSGASGNSLDGYLYTEGTSLGKFNDEFCLEFDTPLNSTKEQWQFNFKTNQKGDKNDATCQVQINENDAGWVDIGSRFGGSNDPTKVLKNEDQIWAPRSVDLSDGGINKNSNTRVRIKIVFPSSGIVWNNDYGIDDIEIVGTQLSTYKLEGITRDYDLSPLGFCRCVLLKHDGSAKAIRDYKIIAQVNSNELGEYIFLGISDTDSRYMVVAYNDQLEKDDVRGCTNDTLTPIKE